jgi:hypothetical protein
MERVQVSGFRVTWYQGQRYDEISKGPYFYNTPGYGNILYKPGIYSISIGQRKNLISEPTKPTIFDFVQGAFHSYYWVSYSKHGF